MRLEVFTIGGDPRPAPERIVSDMSETVARYVLHVAGEEGILLRMNTTVVTPEIVAEFFAQDPTIFGKAARLQSVAARVARRATAEVQVMGRIVEALYPDRRMTNEELVTAIFGSGDEPAQI